MYWYVMNVVCFDRKPALYMSEKIMNLNEKLLQVWRPFCDDLKLFYCVFSSVILLFTCMSLWLKSLQQSLLAPALSKIIQA